MRRELATKTYPKAAITVADALELDALTQGRAEVLSGQANLDRRVRWVHISDLPTAAPSLRGGELLLTHGLGLRQSESLQRRYIRDLENVPIAGLVIELGRGFDRPPSAMVEEARSCGLPLIALQKRIMFVNLTEQVHGEIMRRHYIEVDAAQKLGRELMDVTNRGGGLLSLLQTLSDGLRNPVILEDAAHQVVEFVGYDADPGSMVDEWATHSRLSHQSEGVAVPAAGLDSRQRCASEEIRLRGRSWGRIHVLELDTEIGSRARVAVQYCASAVALVLLEEANLTRLADHVGGNLVADVLARNLSPAEIISRSQVLGCDLSQKVAAIAIEIAEIDGDLPCPRECGLVLDRLSRKVATAIRSSRGSSLSHRPGDSRSILVAIGADDEDQLGNALTAGVRAVADETESSWVVQVGVSEQTDTRRLSDALEHAQEAALLANGGDSLRTASYPELGIERLFAKLSEGPELASYVESQLGPILEHDARSRTQLLPVLEGYLAAGCSKSEAARALYIGRRSLYHRLSSIEGLLGRSLDDASTRTSVEVAIQALKTLQRRRLDAKR